MTLSPASSGAVDPDDGDADDDGGGDDGDNDNHDLITSLLRFC